MLNCGAHARNSVKLHPATRGSLASPAGDSRDERRDWEGRYDAVLIAFSGYRSNFLFDL
jgi:hypothetical protein